MLAMRLKRLEIKSKSKVEDGVGRVMSSASFSDTSGGGLLGQPTSARSSCFLSS